MTQINEALTPVSLEQVIAHQRESISDLRTALATDLEISQLISDVSILRYGHPSANYEDFEGMRGAMRPAFDFRTRSDGSYAERKDAENLASDPELESRVYSIAERLGLTGDTVPENPKARIALVLGGAAKSPLNRTRYTQEMIDRGYLNVEMIALLGSERPVDESERNRAGEYAKEVKTEFGLMVAAAETVYGTKLEPEDIYEGTDPAVPSNMPRHFKIAHIAANGTHPDILIVSAPMVTNPFEVRQGKERARARANTADTYAVLAKVADFQPGDRAVAITNAHFRLFQQADAVGQLAKYGVESEVAGYDPKHFDDAPKTANELLQEMLTAADSLAKAAY